MTEVWKPTLSNLFRYCTMFTENCWLKVEPSLTAISAEIEVLLLTMRFITFTS